MIDIKHIRQKNDGYNWKCGAACLEMVLSYYGVSCDQDDIWDEIKSPRGGSTTQFFSYTIDVAKYAEKQGLPAIIGKAKEECVKDVFEYLDKNACPAILSVMEKKSGGSHFMVYKGIKNSLYYFDDPNCNKSFSYYALSDISDMWSPRPQINVAGYIFIIFSKDFSELNDFCERIGPWHTWVR